MRTSTLGGLEECATWLRSRDVPQRLVRQDGHGLEAAVSNLSSRGCQVDCELTVGELVSVEVLDKVLFLGEVGKAFEGKSEIAFFGAVSH